MSDADETRPEPEVTLTGLRARWREGWTSVFVWFLTGLGLLLILLPVALAIPGTGAWSLVRIVAALAVLFVFGPFVAGAVTRAVFPGARSLEPLRTSTVAIFSDEATAHAALARLEAAGIRAVVTTGEIGAQSGFPIPTGDVRLVVATHDAERASAVLASAHGGPS